MSSTSIITRDCISNLHDSVLCHILSRLRTKDTVRTSILSKDWKHKWTLLYNVDTDFETWDTFKSASSFANFLNEMLLSRQHLRSFRATFWIDKKSIVQKWINAAMRHSLEFLDVDLYGNSVAFPVSLLNSDSLRELKVMQPHLYVKINVAEKNRACNLTSLLLHNVVFVNQNQDSSSVLLEFPLLETLVFSGVAFSSGRWVNGRSVEIYAPSLTPFSCEQKHWDCDYSTKIVAPRLTMFSCLNGVLRNLILDGSSIVTVFLSGWYNDSEEVETIGTRATKLLNGFTNLEELTVSSSMAKVLRNGPSLRHHDKLKRLTLLSGSNANQLFKLLHAMPSLKFLSVNVDKWEYYDYEAMESTPSCIASLEHIELQGFSSEVPQYNLAEFLLKSANNLKKFTGSSNLLPLLSVLLCCSPSLEIC